MIGISNELKFSVVLFFVSIVIARFYNIEEFIELFIRATLLFCFIKDIIKIFILQGRIP